MPQTVIYAGESAPWDRAAPSIFFEGPKVEEWFLAALAYLKEEVFEGTVYIPLPRGKEKQEIAEDALFDWSWKHMKLAKVLAVWLSEGDVTPEYMSVFLPHFALLVDEDAELIVLGYEEREPAVRYVADLAQEQGIGTCRTLADTVREAVRLTRQQ